MKKNLYKIYFSILLIIPIILFLLPPNFFDTGESICLSVVFFEKECFGCGMTKAVQHLIHLDISTAYELNKISIIVLPLLCIVYYKEISRVYSLIKK